MQATLKLGYRRTHGRMDRWASRMLPLLKIGMNIWGLKSKMGKNRWDLKSKIGKNRRGIKSKIGKNEWDLKSTIDTDIV